MAFFLIRLVPGDPIETMAGERGIDPVRHAELRAEYGFDKPLLVQYGIYLERLAHGDLGRSISTKEPVIAEFASLFPATIELGVCAILFALLVGLPAGILCGAPPQLGLRPRGDGAVAHRLLDADLLVGPALILLFSVQLGWTPVSGRIDVRYFIEPVTGFLLIDTLLSDESGAFASALSHLILPAVVPRHRAARGHRPHDPSAMLEVLGEDYMRTARAKGLPAGASSGCMRCATP